MLILQSVVVMLHYRADVLEYVNNSCAGWILCYSPLCSDEEQHETNTTQKDHAMSYTMKRINASRKDSPKTSVICYAVIAFCTVWLTIDFFTKLADTL